MMFERYFRPCRLPFPTYERQESHVLSVTSSSIHVEAYKRSRGEGASSSSLRTSVKNLEKCQSRKCLSASLVPMDHMCPLLVLVPWVSEHSDPAYLILVLGETLINLIE